jgi:hypothetical protein
MRPREYYESKILRELERTRAILNELEGVAQSRRAHAAIVPIHSARDLMGYIEKLRLALRSASGFALLMVSCDVKSARRQLDVWIARLLGTLRGSTSVAS